MKKGIMWIVLSFLMVTSLVLASCSSSTTTAATTATVATPTTATTATPTSTTNIVTIPASTSTTVSTVTATTTSTGNWWDSLGTPQYGNTINIRVPKDIGGFDPYYGGTLLSVSSAWFETLFVDNWTMNPNDWNYQTTFRPNAQISGGLAQSWEFTTPTTFVVHLRQGIYWQNLPPVNGREFTANDVVYHYDRNLGLGDGFTTPSPYQASASGYQVSSITATDNYTVVFAWKISNPEYIYETMEAIGTLPGMEAPEAIAQWGNLNDWHDAVGSGPFILKDFVDSTSATLVKNPNYWGHDERYPQNQLPYVNELNYLIIANTPTAEAAMRAGKIDLMDTIPYSDSQSIKQTNPEIVQIGVPLSTSLTIDPRNDVKPFNDIRVREAMQMAIDLPTIAKTYYGGSCSPAPSTLTSNYMTGWGWPYPDWPASLQAQYAYNPAAAQQLLAAAGYPNGFNTDAVFDNAGDLNLLEIVQSYFAAIGINMSINSMASAAWVAYNENSRKADQIVVRANAGELGSTGAPSNQFTKFQTGALTNWMMVSDPVFDGFGTTALAATTVDAYKQVLTQANQYVAQQHFVISLLEPDVFALYQPWLKGYNAQNSALTGTSSPALVGFYGARFWIDQNMKNNMGH